MDNNTTYSPRQSPEVVGVTTSLMVLLSLFTVVGNLMVIYIFVKHKNLQIAKNYFILSLAIADVFIGTFSINFYNVYLAFGGWPFGNISCDLWLSMDYSCCNVSTLTLLAISIERFVGVHYTAFHRNQFTKKRLKRTIFIIWLISFLVWFPAIFAYPYIHGERTVKDGQCYVQFLYESPSMTIVTAFINFYGPIIFMVIIYILISRTLIKRYKRKYHLRENSIPPETSSERRPSSSRERKYSVRPSIASTTVISPERRPTIATIIGSPSEMDRMRKSYESIVSGDTNSNSKRKADKPKTQREKDYLSHKRAITLLLLIIGAFAITWFPYNLMAVIAPFCRKCIHADWWHFGYIFCYVNSLLNPLCYAFGNRHFKKYFKEIFVAIKKRICCPKAGLVTIKQH
uniref:G-protein coupled receptors family 1 profile domain-containing protein n=2 Tax=Clytia hemisphaerica TaxID=252671 RepID=A0A7M5X0F9_9CNID